MVPNGWKLGVISDLADTVMGYAFKSADFTKAGIPLLRMGNLYQNTLSFDRNPIYLPESFKKNYERFLVKPNDLVMSMTGTMGKRDYGFTVKIPTDAPYSLLNQRVIKFVPKHESSSGFLLNLLRSEIILSRLYAIPGGTKQANLSAKQIQELPAPIPPLPEQRKIATILSTWDKAISTTERLIDNSKQQKKALMKQLLTGAHTQRKRLLDDSGKPFEGEWEKVKLKNISAFITKGATPTTYGYEWQKSGIPFLRSECVGENGFKSSGLAFISNEAHEAMRRSKVFSGDILITITGNVGRVCRLPANLGEANLNQHIAKVTISSDTVEPVFIYHVLNNYTYRRSFERITTGQAYPQLSLEQIRNAVVFLPSKKEQQKIAAVLTNADKEIKLLEQQLADLKQEKKALMQQLLTGERRVKVDNIEAA